MMSSYGIRGVIALVSGLAFLAAGPAEAVPVDVPYVGSLMLEGGAPFDGTATVEMAIYFSSTGGTPQWGPHAWPSLEIENGVLSVIFGGGQSPPLESSLLAQAPLFLQISINGLPLEPRQRMVSVPYSRLAGDASALGGIAAESFATVDELSVVLAGEYALANQDCPSGQFAEGFDASGNVTCAVASLAADCSTCIQPLVDGQGTIGASITGVSNAVASLQGTANGLTTTLSSVQGTANSTNTKVDQLASAVSDLQSDINAIEGTVNTLRGVQGDYSYTCDDFAARGWTSKSACLRDGRWHRILAIGGPFNTFDIVDGANQAFCTNAPSIAAEYRILFDDLVNPPLTGIPGIECSDVSYYDPTGTVRLQIQNNVGGASSLNDGTSNANNVSFHVRY